MVEHQAFNLTIRVRFPIRSFKDNKESGLEVMTAVFKIVSGGSSPSSLEFFCTHSLVVKYYSAQLKASGSIPLECNHVKFN